MTIGIITDSTCDLPKQILQEFNIGVVPLFINIGSREYRDNVDLSHREFYELLPGFRPAPTTASPGPEAFRKIYEQSAAEGANEILSIHISIKLSAIADIARQAAAETKTVRVTVIDSRQLSLGMGFLALTAAHAASQGRSRDEILALLEDQIMRTHVFAALDTLEFLRRSGRMNVAISMIGTLLKIKPLLKMYDGNPTAERVRTRSRAMKRLVEMLEEYRPYEKVAILHSNAAERASGLLREIKPLLPSGETIMEEITPVLGTHLGPGVIGFACISKK